MQAHPHKPPADAYKTNDNIVEDSEDVLYWRREEQCKELNSPVTDDSSNPMHHTTVQTQEDVPMAMYKYYLLQFCDSPTHNIRHLIKNYEICKIKNKEGGGFHTSIAGDRFNPYSRN